jgi:hypothetical protein
MNLPDAPIAHEGFFATHFFTVKDQEKSKDFYVRILGGKVITPACRVLAGRNARLIDSSPLFLA